MLPQTKELGDYFGKHKNGAGKSKIVETVMAKFLVRADLLNKYVIQNEVFKTTESELSICKTWLWQLNCSSISIFDRGFGSAAMFAYLVQNNKPLGGTLLVCRLKISFNWAALHNVCV